MALQLRLFGEFEIVGPERESLALPTRRSCELLARLALEGGRSLDKNRAASEIWPFVPTDSAKQSLRKALSFIKGSLGSTILSSSSGLRLAPGIESDISKAKSALYRAKLSSAREEEALELAVVTRILERPLLEGWESEWISPFRCEWQKVRFTALLKLSDHHKHLLQKEASLQCALEASKLEPLSEAAAARVLSAYDELGQFSKAEEFYRQFASNLEIEVDLSPSRDLVELSRQIRTKKTGIYKPEVSPAPSILSLLIDQVYQQNPAQLMDMLASEGLSWLVYTRAHEALPVFARVAESVETWNEAHRKVVKDLLALSSFVCEIDLLKRWSRKLKDASPAGSYDSIVADCMAARWMSAEGDLAGSIRLLESAGQDAAVLGNEYLASVVLANQAGCLYALGEYQSAMDMMQSQLSMLLTSTTRRGRLALAEAYAAISLFALSLGDVRAAKASMDECWKIVSVADIGGMETGRTALKGLVDLLSGEDRTGRNIAEGLAASVQHRNTSAVLSSLTHASAGLHALGFESEAKSMAITVKGLSAKIGLCIHPCSFDFFAKYAGVDLLTDQSEAESVMLFEGNLPQIAAWLHELFAS